MTPFQRMVALGVLEAVERQGFALGGGQAVVAHGFIDRPSDDLDLYVQEFDSAPFIHAETEIIRTLSRKNLGLEVLSRDDVFRAIQVTDLESGEKVKIDLGYDYRVGEPVEVQGLFPVLSVHDVATGKVRALLDRGEPRDFADFTAIHRSSAVPEAELQSILKSQLIGRDQESIRASISRVNEIDDNSLAELGITTVSSHQIVDALGAHPRLSEHLRPEMGSQHAFGHQPEEQTGDIWVSPHERDGHPVSGHWRARRTT